MLHMKPNQHLTQIMNFITKKHFFFLALILMLLAGILSLKQEETWAAPQSRFWDIQAVDTMKYSRDVSREKLNDPTFDVEINRQMKDIADLGATHVGIATPYDDEFLPILKRWVKSAREHNLKIWFRGNFSGWEQWFEYPKITREQHLDKTKRFIESNPELFEDGDIFSACPECENGGPGDPRMNGDATGHTKFLIDSYNVSKEAFKKIKKDVPSNYMSMNGDVARLIMTPETTKALDGLVTIDHYVETPEKLEQDIKDYAQNSGGQVFLGEWGAPIPDINGDLTPAQQAEWIKNAGTLLASSQDLAGLSYWVNKGGSTQLWNENGTKRPAADALKALFKPSQAQFRVVNEAGGSISNALVEGTEESVFSNAQGYTALPYISSDQIVSVYANGYRTKEINIKTLKNSSLVVLQKENENVLFRLQKLIKQGFNFINSPFKLN